MNGNNLMGKLVAGALSAACAIALVFAVAPAGGPSPVDAMSDARYLGSPESAAVPSVPADGESGRYGETAPSGEQGPASEAEVSADGTVTIEGEHEQGVVLVQFGLGADPELLTEAFADLPCLGESIPAVTEADIEEGFIALPVADGYNVADAVAALDTVPGTAGAQPNYIYHIADGALSVEDGAGLIAADVSAPLLEGTDLLDALADVNDPYGKQTAASDYNWHLKSINAYEAWSIVKGQDRSGGDRVTVAVLDSGYDKDHEDLTNGAAGGVGGNVIDAFDATGNAEERFDSGLDDINSSHGTHVAGIIAGIANNGKGVAGVSHNANVLPIQVFYNKDGKRNASTITLRYAYQYIIDNADRYNIRVANMSLGGSGSDSVLMTAIENAYSKGVLTVCAAGNNVASDSYLPVDFLTHGMGVIALDKDRRRASYSNYNIASDHVKKDISAPGTLVYSTIDGSSYGAKQGTSMASPVVAGVAALVFTANPDLGPGDVMEILHNTALDLQYANGDEVAGEGFDQYTGYGEVDAKAAVEKASYSLKGDSALLVGGTTELSPSSALNAPNPPWGAWTWESSDTSVATVENGVVTGVAAGTATITATSGTVKVSKTVTVYSLTYTVSGDAVVEPVEIELDDTISLTVSQQPSGAGVFDTWYFTLSDGAVLSGPSSGSNTITLTGLAAGDAYLVATLKENSNVVVRLHVKVLDASTKRSLESSRAAVYWSSSDYQRALFYSSFFGWSTASSSPSNYYYTGFAVEPSPYLVTYTLDSGTSRKRVALSEGANYELSYENNVDAGTATVTITGIGSYEGSISQTFTINQTPLVQAYNNGVLSVSGFSDVVYTGEPVEPVPVFTLTLDGNYVLVQGTDFTVGSYANNTNAALYNDANAPNVAVTGIGNFTGNAKVSFTIQQASLSGAEVTATGWEWDGEAHVPALAVSLNGSEVAQEGNWTYEVTKDGEAVSLDSIVDVGTYMVTVTGQGNYKDSATATFEVAPRSIAGAQVSATGWMLDGKNHSPQVSVALDGTALPQEGNWTYAVTKDGQAVPSDSIVDAGTYTVIVTGQGNYRESASTTFTVAPGSLQGAEVSAEGWTWDGLAHDPHVAVTLDGAPIPQEHNWTVALEKDGRAVTATDVLDAGTYQVTVTGDANYGGTAATTFAVERASISSAVLSGLDAVVYTGEPLTPSPTLKLPGGYVLKAGTDYEIGAGSYTNNTEASANTPEGHATVTIEGIGNFTGSRTDDFTIHPASLKGAAVAATGWTYDGAVHDPGVKVRFNGGELAQDGNWTCKITTKEGLAVPIDRISSAGTYTVSVTGEGNYADTATTTFTVKPRSIEGATVKLQTYAYVYDGTARKPAVESVALPDGTVLGTGDYAVSYAGNTGAGTATAKVTGVGNYGGSASASFAINAAAITELSLSASAVTYNGREQKPAVTVKAGSSTLPASDYEVAYRNNVNVGTATVSVTGSQNVTGSKSATFAINPAPITGVALAQSSFEYDGTAKTPPVTVRWQGGVVPSDSYTVSYSGNVNAGTASVTVSAREGGNFSGSKSATFAIARRPAVIAAKDASKAYDGAPLLATDAGYTTSGFLSASDVASVSLAGSLTDAGAASSIVSGYELADGMAGNYDVSTASGTLQVTAASLAWANITLSQDSYVYDGNAKQPEVTVTVGGRVLTAGVDYDVVYTDNVEAGTARAMVNGKGNYYYSKAASFAIEEPDPITHFMYRLYNPYSGEHFYTASASERDEVIAAGWSDEGVGWNAPDAGDPVYRLYNPYAGEHHYTLDAAERDQLTASGWIDEGIGWYSDPSRAVPLYREYNPYMFAWNHNYTSDRSEHDGLVSLGWIDEGVAWYGA